MSKKSKKAQPEAEVHALDVLTRPATPVPTYPLFPGEIEMIVYLAWDGKQFGISERAGTALALEGEDLQTFVRGLPFNGEYKAPDARQVEISAANDADARWLMDRAHRLQLVTPDGSLPAELEGAAWRAGKPGVQKPDGVGILLVRPAA